MSIWRKDQWFGNIRGDVLAGITATLALIPDSLAFSFIAGVSPMVGIYASVCILLVTTFLGGRPGMISAAAGSMAVLMTHLVAEHGIQYLFAATILTGILQYLMGILKLGRWMSFVPNAVITGFINALAILIFLSQLKNFSGESWPMYVVVGVTLLIIYVLPRFFKKIPSPLVAVGMMTVVVLLLGWQTKSVGDLANITPTLPSFFIPDIPWNLSTLWIILPYSLSLAVVGFTETLLTQDIVDEMTGVQTNKNKEMVGQGAANVVTGFFGGMAGCALIAESAINIKLGGKTRLSTLVAAVALLLLAVVFGPLLNYIPMAALVGVMLMVCIEIFDWKYLGRIHKVPRSEAFVMIVTVGIVVYTHDLAIGVLVGVLLSVLLFAHKTSKIQISREELQGGDALYKVKGPLFFVSSSKLQDEIGLGGTSDHVSIDLSEAPVMDHSAGLALDKIVNRLEQNGKSVRIIHAAESGSR
ncbi:SulP family inorganic anion transporter [Paenibacillus sabuli]|nr:SulP family inorganic anion transporter [Paenibacillus sabuli]